MYRMNRSIINRKRGFTLIEAVVSTLIMLTVTMSTAMMVVFSMKYFDKSSAQTFSDTNAVIAMQRIVTDVREAKVVILQDMDKDDPTIGHRLHINMPVYDQTNDCYDNSNMDSATPVVYFLSDDTGVIGHPGKSLWRVKGSLRSKIVDNVSLLAFQFPPNPNDVKNWDNSIEITIHTQVDSADGPRTTQLTQRVVFLRNYRLGTDQYATQ